MPPSLETLTSSTEIKQPHIANTARLLHRIWLWGVWHDQGAWLDALLQHGYRLTLVPHHEPLLPTAAIEADLLLLSHVTVAAVRTFSTNIPWLLWNQTNDSDLTAAAYQAGALTVLPAQLTPAVLVAAVRNALALTPPRLAAAPQRHFRKNEPIHLNTGSKLLVEQGVVAMTTLHDDGSTALMGLYGPGYLLIGHGDDHCAIHLTAHTAVTVQITPQERGSTEPLLISQLQSRIAFMEAWAAMQARPHLEQRLLGLLELLGEQFGQVQATGLLVNLRLTHEQLASALGCTRTSVTRTISNLRQRGLLTTLTTTDGERFCLSRWDPVQHSK